MIPLVPAPQMLVIGIARIGDTLLLSACLRALKAAFPAGSLTVLVHAKRRAVLENFPPIDRLASISKQRARFKGYWPGKPYDIAFVYGRDRALLDYALRTSRQVVCFDEKVFAGVQSPALHRVALPQGPIHAVDERLSLINPVLNAMPVVNRRLGLALLPEEKAGARGWLAAQGIAQRPLIGLQTFSFPTKAHRDWPLDSFIDLMAGILAVHPQAYFLLLGDQLAATQLAAIRARLPAPVSIVAGQFDLRQSAALMSQLDLYVGVDTGPTHMAGALDIPMVALYHHRYPGRNLMPLDHPRCVVIEHPATGQALAEDQGMQVISVSTVLDAALGLLAEGRDA